MSQTSAYWIDPDHAGSAGVLLSDRIRLYVDAIGMISPFSEARLQPASYDLTVGAEFAYHENLKKTGQATANLSPGENLVIPPNSIVFVSTAEALNLPFYIVARFNLKLRYLHQGLLVGTGPQIDPGFSGQLSCPLHNISSEKITLTAGAPFAIVEFQKTTRFAEKAGLTADDDFERIRQEGERGGLAGVNGRPCKTFPRRALHRRAVSSYLPAGKSVSSSLEGLATALQTVKGETVARLDASERRIGVVSVVSFVAVAVVAIGAVECFVAFADWYSGLAEAAYHAKAEVTRLETDKHALERRLAVLESQMRDLRPDPASASPVDAQGNAKPNP